MNLLLLVVAVALLAWACWATGALVDRGLGLRCPWWFRLGAGQAALGTLWTWMIAGGIFRPSVVALTLIAGALAGTWTVYATAAARPSPGMAPPLPSPETRANVFERAMLLLYVTAAALLACYPYQGSDFLSYQLPMARGYAAEGGWMWFDDLRFPTFPPLMNGWFAVMLMLGGRWQIVLAQLSALLPLLVLCVLLVRMTRDADPEARPPWAVALFLGSPAVAWAGIHAYVDGAMTLFMVMAAWCVMRFAAAEGFSATRVPWRWLIAAGALVGAAMNTKYLGAAFVPLIAAWLLLSWWTNGGAPARSIARLAGGALAFVGSAFLVCAPWYLTTWIRTGNPVFPFVQPVFGSNPWGWNVAPLAELQNKPGDLLATPLAWDGLSPWLLPTTIIASWVWLRRGPSLAGSRGLPVFVGLGYLGLWFLMPDDRRYLLPALALLSVAGASAVGSIVRRIPLLLQTAIGRAAVTGLLMLLGLAFLADQIREQGGPPPGPEHDAYVERTVPGVAALAWAEENLAPRRVFAPNLEEIRSFATSATVVGDWSGPWSRVRLLVGVRTAEDLIQRLVENDIDALIERQCRKDLRQHWLRIEGWLREGRFPHRLDFGVRAATRPFASTGDQWPALTDLDARDVEALFEEALEVVHRDGDICVLRPRTAR